MVLGKLPVPGLSTIWMTVGQGRIVLAVAVGAGVFFFFFFFFLHFFSCLSFLLVLPHSGRRSDTD